MFLPQGIFLGGAFKATFTSPAGEPSAIVSGAGTAAANGTYTERGTSGGKPYYNKLGEPDSTTNNVIVWADLGLELCWNITDSGGLIVYYDAGGGSPPFPWNATLWDRNEGDLPTPTVTEG